MVLSSALEDIVQLPEYAIGQLFDSMTREEALSILYDWTIWARPNQLPPSTWGTQHSIWLIKAGRGYGKTRSEVEITRAQVESGRAGRVGIVAETAADARDVIVEGESGFLATAPPWFRPQYEPSKRRLTWPNGAIATMYSAEDPEQLRGPQHDFIVADEIGKWKYEAAWDNAMFGLRLGESLAVAATTPRRTPLMLTLLKDPDVVVTEGTTYENVANLSERFIKSIVRRYEGTRLGRQELLGHLLEELQGALWSYALLDETRVAAEEVPNLEMIVVGVDPAETSNIDSDETGIVVAGRGTNGHGYVLADASCQMPPAGWAGRVVAQYDNFEADHITAEINAGGEMVEHTIRTIRPDIPIKVVRASRGKIVRAEPVSSLYQQGKVHHVGTFPVLEDQMCNYVQGARKSPDHLDALVWTITDLFPNVEPEDDWEVLA